MAIPRVTRARAKSAAQDDQVGAQLAEPAAPPATRKPAGRIILKEHTRTSASRVLADDDDCSPRLELGLARSTPERRGRGPGRGTGRARGAALKAREALVDLDAEHSNSSNDSGQQRKVKLVTEQNVV